MQIEEVTVGDRKSNVPSTPGGNVTRSTVAPFSDKLMMYSISLFCSFSMGGNFYRYCIQLKKRLAGQNDVVCERHF